MAYQFKIQIKGISNPPVWRKVIVPANFTFLRFHDVIQVTFGWEDYHSFEFRDKIFGSTIRIATPAEEDNDFGILAQDASKVKLSQIFTGDIQKFIYIYDFGDDWIHEITLEEVIDDKRRKAICLSGEGSCPPEDCGGCGGYEGMKHILQKMPQSEEAKSYREWLELEEDEVFDTTFFDIDEANLYLKDI